MQEAVQRAIDGGWEAPYEYGTFEATENYIYFYPRSGQGRIDYPTGFALLNPLFWQGIGKAMGWSKALQHKCSTNGITRVCWAEDCFMCDYNKEGKSVDGISWLCEWHRFIDHLAKGKDTEDFFKELLK